MRMVFDLEAGSGPGSWGPAYCTTFAMSSVSARTRPHGSASQCELRCARACGPGALYGMACDMRVFSEARRSGKFVCTECGSVSAFATAAPRQRCSVWPMDDKSAGERAFTAANMVAHMAPADAVEGFLYV